MIATTTRTGRDGETGLHDRVVPDSGEEQDVAEEHGEEPGGVHDGGGVGDDERAAVEQGGVDHWVVVVQGAVREHGAGDERYRERAEDAPIGPAPRRAFRDGEHQ